MKWPEKKGCGVQEAGEAKPEKTKEEMRGTSRRGDQAWIGDSLETQRRDSLAGKRSCQTARKLKVGRKLESGI